MRTLLEVLVVAAGGPDGQKMLRVFLRNEFASAVGDGSLDKVLGTSFGVRRRGVAR